LINVNGKLYGTTYSGGAAEYDGTVFRVSTSGREKLLHSFAVYSDGANPVANLIYVKGALYGTRQLGGQMFSEGDGTVFSISTAGAKKVLYSFSSSGGAARLLV
jgi:uncharacterized repeat protein (TIGR03803 family)